MYQFLLDLYRYCNRNNIKFYNLTYDDQKIIIRKSLKYTLTRYISKRQKSYIKGDLTYNDILLSFYNRN